MQLPPQLSRENIPEPTESDSESDDSDEDPLLMLSLLESAKSEMLRTLAQLLGDQAETSGEAEGAATTEGVRPEEVVLVRYYHYLKSTNSASLKNPNYSYR